jgi:hypothetical protein
MGEVSAGGIEVVDGDFVIALEGYVYALHGVVFLGAEGFGKRRLQAKSGLMVESCRSLSIPSQPDFLPQREGMIGEAV